MGFLLTLFGIALVVCLLVYVCEYKPTRRNQALGAALAAGVIATIVIVLIFGVIKMISYTNYLDMMEKQVTIEQEVTGVKAYAENGVGVFFPGQLVGKELTDFKFGAYQEEMSDKIKRLKNMVQSYNEHVISKKLMKNNWYWNWWIYMPDMSIQTIEMGQLLKDKEQGNEAGNIKRGTKEHGSGGSDTNKEAGLSSFGNPQGT